MEAAKTTLDSEICKEKNKEIKKALIRLQLAEKDKDREKKASAYKDLAWLYHVVEDYEQSIAYGEKLLDISAQMGNEEFKVKANANHVLAWAYKDIGDYEKSQSFCRELLRIGDGLRDEQLKASTYEVQAWLYFAAKDYTQSSQEGKKFRNASKNLGDKRLEAKALDVLAWSFLKREKYQQSKNYGEEFLLVSEDLSDQVLKAHAMEVLALVFYELENYKRSKEYGQDLLDISKKLGRKKGEARAYEVLAESYIQEGNDQEGRKYAKELLRISKKLGSREHEAKACEFLAKLYCKEGNDQESRKYNKELLRISKELGNKEQQAEAWSDSELEKYEQSREISKVSPRVAKKEEGKTLQAEASGCSGWSDSELEKYEQSKEISKVSPRVAKKEEGKTLQAEASGCSVPSEIRARGPRAKLAYENALKTGKVKVYRTRIMLIGQGRAGKTSLKKSFLGLPFDPEEESTNGIEVDPSKFEVDIDQVKNWECTDEKFGVSQFASDLAKMVAEELQKDENEEIEDEGKDEDGNEGKGEGTMHLAQYGLDALGERHEEETSAFISQTSQGISGKDKKETNTALPTDLNVDFNLPPEEVIEHLDKHLKGLNLPSDVKEVEQHMILDLWDFAGQHLYYASYPVFLSPRALYMLVYDLSKDLKDTAQPCFKQGIREIPESNPNKETNLENLLTWLVSLRTMCSLKPEENHQQTTYCRPPVFIVGTHADKPYQDITDIESQIKQEISRKDYECHVIRPFFSVDNTQGSSDDGVAALQKRMIEVLKQEPYMGVELPIRWFNFEKVVQALTANNVNYLNVDDLQDIIEKVCFIRDKVEAATMLDFYHDLGVIVRHGKTVVLRAKWLIDVFRQLITIRPFDHREPKYSKMWNEMDESGLLCMELVDHVFSKFRLQDLTKEDILNMMEQFGLIAKFTSPVREMYFVPCQLKTPPDAICEMEPSPSDPCPVYLYFPGGFVPHGFFWQLVSRCIRWCSMNGFTQPPKLFLSACRFFIDEESIHRLIFLCQKRFIKILLTPSEPVHDGALVAKAREVRTFLEDAVKNLRSELHWLSNLKCDFCVACSDSLHKKKKCSKHATVSCHHEDCLCLIKIRDKGQLRHCPKSDRVPTVVGLEKWFETKAVSPGNHPGTKAVYKMTAIPRGMALIVNNWLFDDDVKGKLTRVGSEIDVDLVKALFEDLGFKVKTRKNLTKEDLMKELDSVVCQDHSAYDCFVLWLMTHGKSGEVMCSDKDTILFETLWEMFSKCRALRGKPKLFFIQACRGDEEDEGMSNVIDADISAYEPVNESNEANNAVSAEDSVNQPGTTIPTNADILLAFSTVDRFVAYRNERKGSYYIRCLVEVFREHVTDDHLLDILTLVNKKVSEVAVERKSAGKKDEMRICKQMSEVRHTLRKKLRF